MVMGIVFLYFRCFIAIILFDFISSEYCLYFVQDITIEKKTYTKICNNFIRQTMSIDKH